MAIKPGYQENFETLKRASEDGALCIMECADAKTGKSVIAICAVSSDGTEYTMTPLAKMFDGNPYKEILPPVIEAA